MSISASPWSIFVTLASFVLLFFAPGLLLGVSAGLRGWRLVGLAPLLSYGVVAIAGPLLPMVNLPFNGLTFVASTVLFACLLALARYASKKRGNLSSEQTRLWARQGDMAVAGSLVLAAGIGAYAVYIGLGSINAIPQGFDAAFHANGIRYVAKTGDSGLFSIGAVHWYDGGSFYPNAYHLISALAYELSGATIPAVLNAHTMLLGGLLALSTVTMVRHFGGRAVLAGFSALTVVSATMVTYGTWSSPLLPYTLAVAFTPLIVVAGHRYLLRPAWDTGLVLAVGAVALLAIHSSALFGGLLFALPLLIWRWWSSRSFRTASRDLAWLIPVAAAGVLLGLPHILGALHLAGNFHYTGWVANYTGAQALGELVAFSHNSVDPQLLLAAAMAIGLITLNRLGELRWIAGAAAIFGIFYLAVATSDHPLVMALSRPWWDDRFRLAALAGLAMCVLAAHGLAEVQRFLRDRLVQIQRRPRRRAIAGTATAVVVLLGFVTATYGGYYRENADYVALTWGNTSREPTAVVAVTPEETEGMLELGRRAQPGEWALNDWYDGSVWTYAISGVRTIVAHDEMAGAPSDSGLLTQKFREYATNPAVRDAVARRNIHWVILGTKLDHPDTVPRAAGLRNLAGLPFLQEVYRNPDVVLYRITG